jgi:hypothetical protein
METKTSENFTIAARAFIDVDGTSLLACIRKDPSQSGYELAILDQKIETVFQKNFEPKNEEDELVKAGFCYAPYTSKLLLILEKRSGLELAFVEKQDQYDIKEITSLPKGSLRQTRTNPWWAAILATDGLNMSLYWVDLDSGKIHQGLVGMHNKSSHLTVAGKTRDTTKCYLVERFGGNYHLSWFSPKRKVTEQENNKIPLRYFDSHKENILFMDTFEDRIVIVAQDNRRRQGIATLAILVIQLGDEPTIARRIELKDYHAPLGVTTNEDGFLMLVSKENLGWISIQAKGDSHKPDGYISTSEKETTRFYMLRNSKDDFRILSWFPKKGFMNGAVHDCDGNQIKKFVTDFELDVASDGVLYPPRIFGVGTTFFASMASETCNYIKSHQVDIE